MLRLFTFKNFVFVHVLEFKKSQKMKKDAAAKKRQSKETKKATDEDVMEVEAETAENDEEDGE